jgi:crotonobetainyl-CoA:carnitine CoA-transferase CaiB-like acyl-CoA transferase
MSSPPKFWEALAQAIERPALFEDPRFATREARIEHQAEMIEVLTAIFRTRPRAQWCRRLEALDVPHAPMYDTSEVPDDPQARHLQLFVDAPHPDPSAGSRWRTVRSPVSFDGERALEVTAPPLLGDCNAVLRAGGSPWTAPTSESDQQP